MPPRAERLLRRYPLLRSVPPADRAAIVRDALKHPLVLVPLLGGGMLLLPLYLRYAFTLLGVESEPNILLMLAKAAGATLVPVVLAVPLFSRLIMPRAIRWAMQKRGYTVT